MDNAQDVIQTALDAIGTRVTLTVSYPGNARITHVDGLATGFTHIDGVPHVCIDTDIRSTVVSIDHIISIDIIGDDKS